MKKHKANLQFTDRRGYDRLALLAALRGKTLGDQVAEMVETELKRLRVRIGIWEGRK